MGVAGIPVACQGDQPQNEGTGEVAVSRSDPLSPHGAERVIPITFFQMFHISQAQDLQVYRWVQDNVQIANETFRPAGVQFVIRDYKKCNGDGTFALNADDTQIPFDAAQPPFAKDELECAFGPLIDPQLSPVPYRRQWLDWATLHHGRQSDVVVWLHETFPGYKGNGVLPWAGPAVIHLQARDHLTDRNLLAHELGHTIGGFAHADACIYPDWDTNGCREFNPRTGMDYIVADFWDLVRHAPTDRYFTSRDDLVMHQTQNGYPDSALSFIIPNYGPSADNCGRVEATIGGIQYLVPDARLKGLGRALSTPCNLLAPRSWSYATNIMALGITPRPNFYGHLSDSQVERVRNYLRYEAPIRDSHWVPNAGGLPHGRSKLGRFENRQPAVRLDFNQDNLRDIAWWVPPTTAGSNGQFTVLLSPSFSTAQVINFGQLGDIPVPADYNGDGVTDLALFSPGGGINRDNPFDENGYWRVCLTPADLQTWTCSTSATYVAGRRGDVPLPGLDFDGDPATPHLSVYRPSTGSWLWGPVGFWLVPSSRTLGNELSIPLPDLYDNDSITDLVVYDPGTARVHLRLSGANWNTLVTRQFAAYTSLVGIAGASIEQRSAAIPVRGMYRRTLTGFLGGTPQYKPRAAVSLWSPWDTKWHTMWNPVAGDPEQTCVHGAREDVPIGGVGTDWRTKVSNPGDHSKLTVYRSNEYGGTSYLRFLSPLPTDCRYSTAYNVSFIWAASKSLPFAVRDMTGDGLPEIMLLGPASGTLRYFTSPNFTTAHTVQLGSHMAIVL
jgi:hypothetical protein